MIAKLREAVGEPTANKTNRLLIIKSIVAIVKDVATILIAILNLIK